MASLTQRLGFAAFAAVILAGCSAEPGTAPSRSVTPGSALRDESAENGAIMACKLSGPANNYTLHMDVQGGGFLQMTGGPTAVVNFNGSDLVCAQMAYADFPDTWVGKTATLTLSETNFPSGTHLDSVVVYNSRTGVSEKFIGNNVQHAYNFGDQLWFKFWNSADVIPPPTPGAVRACKVGGPAGTYSFHVDVLGGGSYTLPSGATGSVSFNGTTPACTTMYVPTGTWTFGQTASVEISEVNIASNLMVKSITVTTNGVVGSPQLNTSSTSVTVGFPDVVSVDFVNAVKPPTNNGNQGCTPGYWKVKQHWDSWAGTGYTTTQALSTVFNIPAAYTVKNQAMGSYSMVQGLSFQGGTTLSGKAEILVRAAVAAVLNAGNSNVSYAMSKADIISQVNAALAGGNATTIGNLATKLDGYNNGLGGCPLN
jgi:hypothetical protein